VNQSDAIDAFAAGMAKVQTEIGGAVKGSVNPAFKSKYADLSAVWEAWQVIGPKNGFAVMQFPGIYDPEAKTMGMDTLITHSSGQWVRGAMTIPLTKVDAQGYGSACTYARRYALSAAVGICPEDDDANGAIARNGSRAGNDTGEAIDDAQLSHLQQLASAGGADLAKFCAYFKVPSLKEIRAADYPRAVEALSAKLKKAA
jgi:hypothetical protein